MIVRQFIKVINPGDLFHIVDESVDSKTVLEGRVSCDHSALFIDAKDSDWYENVYANFHIVNISVIQYFTVDTLISEDPVIPVYQIKVR
jgi:hypothetical protein